MKIEVPFAGHPNIGTAVVLAQDLEASGRAPVDQFVFEETAGLVPIILIRDRDHVVGAELTPPEALSIRSSVSLEDAARCALVSLDSTMRSNISVGPPVDLALLPRDALKVTHSVRLDLDTPYYSQLKETWARQLENAVRNLPRFEWELQPQLPLQAQNQMQQQPQAQMQNGQNGQNAAAQMQPRNGPTNS